MAYDLNNDLVTTKNNTNDHAAPALSLVNELTVPEEIRQFIDNAAVECPALVVQQSKVEEAYERLTSALAPAKCFYAVKANPAPAVLRTLAAMGSNFDVASRGEIDLCLSIGITADRLSYGAPVKRPSSIAYAHEKGINLFTTDCEMDVEAIAANAPGARVMVRIAVESVGAEWPLSRKFGCPTDRAVPLAKLAQERGLDPVGLAFHVGSQQTNLDAWDKAFARARKLFDQAAAQDIHFNLLNLGGGMPANTSSLAPNITAYGQGVMARLNAHFPEGVPNTMFEPGRAMVAEAGVIAATVILVAENEDREGDHRWVYLDIGRYSGLAETLDEAIRYPMIVDGRNGAPVPSVMAGPSCDSTDTLYEKNPYPLPADIQPGDRIWIMAAGAYTSSYSSINFNGYDPLATYVI